MAKGIDDLLDLAMPHQSVVDEDAGQPIADRPVHKRGRDRRSLHHRSERKLPCSFPTRCWIAAMLWSMKFPAVHVWRQPHTRTKKFSMTDLPSGVWMTSGWN